MTGASTLVRASPLRQRVVTAFVLGPVVMAAVLLLPTPGFAAFLGLVALGAAWEWGALAGLEGRPARAAFVALAALGLLLLWLFPDWRPWLVAAGALWWAVQAVRIAGVREIAPCVGCQPRQLAAGLLVLAAPWSAMVDLHEVDRHGPLLVLFLMMLVWTADSLAYFVGRRWGRTKLAPAVSPGKTRAGVYGALAGAALWGLILGWARSLGPGGTLVAALVCVVAVLASVVGDLYESLLKRQRGVKDSSQLLPGHGGLLDRLDSLTAAAPVFVLGLTLSGALG